MAYNDTPLPTQTPSQSQPLMRQNFQQIGTSYNTDHIPLTSGSNVGYSNKLTLVSQSGDPGSVAGTGIFYTKGSPAQAFFENAAAILQLTNLPIVVVGANSGLTTPFGLVINWGIVVPSTTGTSVTFAVPFNGGGLGSLNLQAQSTVVNTLNNVVTPGNISNSGFKAYSQGTPATYYFAIGK